MHADVAIPAGDLAEADGEADGPDSPDGLMWFKALPSPITISLKIVHEGEVNKAR